MENVPRYMVSTRAGYPFRIIILHLFSWKNFGTDLGPCQLPGFMLTKKNQPKQEDKHDYHSPEYIFILSFDDEDNEPDGCDNQKHAGGSRQRYHAQDVFHPILLRYPSIL
jgi:hypothetical protein